MANTVRYSYLPQQFNEIDDLWENLKEFVKTAFEVFDLNYENYIKINKNLFRPSEVKLLKSNSKKIKKQLGWKHKINFNELVSKMVISDYNILKQEIK